MKRGDLVRPTTHGAWRDVGGHGIVISTYERWPNSPREDEMIVEVLFTATGDKCEFSEYNVEVISESR